MRRTSRLLAVAGLLASACATAPTRPEAAAPQPAAEQRAVQPAPEAEAKDARPKMICRMERSTGSNIQQEVCRPATDNSENVHRLQDQLKSWRGQWLRGGG